MKNATLFREYVWLVNTIARADRISLVEINEQWVKTEISGGLPFAHINSSVGNARLPRSSKHYPHTNKNRPRALSEAVLFFLHQKKL